MALTLILLVLILALALTLLALLTFLDSKSENLTPVAAISYEWWGSGAEPPAGARGRAPGQGSEGHSPHEAEKKLNFDNMNQRSALELGDCQ